MVRLFAVLFALFVVGCSTSVPTVSKPTTFEDSFRRKEEHGGTPFVNKIPFVNRLVSNTVIGYGDFPWDGYVGKSIAVVSPDGNWLLVAGRKNLSGFATNPEGLVFLVDNSVSLWSLTDPEIQKTSLIEKDSDNTEIDWLAFTADSSQFFLFRRPAHHYRPGTLKRYDRATGKELQTISPSIAALTGAVSPDGRFLVAVTMNSLEVWNAADGRKIGSIPFETNAQVDAIRFSPDGRWLFFACWSDGIHVFDLQLGQRSTTIPTKSSNEEGMQKTCFAVSSDGKTLLVIDSQKSYGGGSGGSLRFIEIGSWRVVREIAPADPKNVTHGLYAVCFAPEGDKLYGAGYRRTETKPTNVELKSFLGEFDLNRENATWTDIPYETLPLHPIGKRLMMHCDGTGLPVSPFHERMGVDYNLTFKMSKPPQREDGAALLSDAEIVIAPSDGVGKSQLMEKR